MQSSADNTFWPFQRLLIFWWILFLLIQQAERLFLLLNALSQEVPSAQLLVQVLTTGLRADLIVATFGIMIVAALGGALALLLAGVARWRGITPRADFFRRGFTIASILVAFLLVVVLTLDTGYYIHSQHHLDFVFFEYLGNLFMQGSGQAEGTQAFQQTTAEVREGEKWLLSSIGLIGLEAAMITAWWL
jgi:hypothetical protein